MMRLLEMEGYDVLVYTYRPGTVFPEHQHAQNKCDGVLSGTLRITVGDAAFDLGPAIVSTFPAERATRPPSWVQKTVVSLRRNPCGESRSTAHSGESRWTELW